MDTAVFFLVVLFLVGILILGGIVFATRAAELRTAAARARAASAEKGPKPHRLKKEPKRIGTMRAFPESTRLAPDDDAAALFYAKVPKQFLYTKQQAATALAMSTGHLNELIHARKIRAVKDGGRVKFTPADLQAYVDSLPSWGGPPAAEPERGELTRQAGLGSAHA